MIQGGDFTHGDGTGGESIYGEYFPDEIPIETSPQRRLSELTHKHRNFLTMANKDRSNSQSSQFFINTVKTTWLDGVTGNLAQQTGQNLIIGIVLEGQDVVTQIERQGTISGVPRRKIVIRDSGELSLDRYDLTNYK